ncbi:hypothetical protein FHR81_003102 [Actinoalloteichus hoggarensis]|uniref:Uncharacterized protein n=1 Tax=Actinoalloteichus hoggarensis TaxID=1470176 RepID=A0A221W6S1_9PSEU|nr:hypothetical protein [Actinoalloteichus hoggarensis]ASO21461.1 hypothetical protein AHOG_19195 [Actinoalloteichus hoggarensis]MBB5922050.1 hypothetical protein [Actinoalloteichus hoggarensis]
MTSQHTDDGEFTGVHHGIMVIDTHGFSAHDDVQQTRLTNLIPEILEEAARRGGAERLLRNPPVRATRGDGLCYAFELRLLPLAVDRLMDALQGELRVRAPRLRADGITLRMRASLHLGPMPPFNPMFVDSPNGKVMIDTHRMVGAAEVRALLDRSDPQVTFLATVVSDAVMEQLIRAGHTVRKPTEFVRTALTVEAKGFECVGHLRVPVLSGELLAAGLLARPHNDADADRSTPPPVAPLQPATTGTMGEPPQAAGTNNTNASNSGHRGLVAQSRDVGHIADQSITMGSGPSGVTVSGNNNAVAGGDLDQSTGRQDFSGTFHIGADGNFGSHSGRRGGLPNESGADS